MRHVRAKDSPIAFDPKVTGRDRIVTIPTEFVEVDEALAKVIEKHAAHLVEFQEPEAPLTTPAPTVTTPARRREKE